MSQDLVKSAARAIEILELFANTRKRMNSAQIAASLGYPKSSLSLLLRSLLSQGYLSTGNGDQDYFPTLKLARLGDWIPAALLGSESLLPMLTQLRDRTGETVTLTMASDLHMQCLHALIGTHPIALQVEEGVAFPMMGSAIGTMYLAGLEPAAVRMLYDRWATQVQGAARRSFADLSDPIKQARTAGHSAAYDAVLTDTGAIAMPLKMEATGETLIVAVAGLSARIQRQEDAIIKVMAKMIGTVERG